MNPSDNLIVWRLLLALGRTNSLTRASIEADVELSAASRLLSSLEHELAASILDRSTKPYRVTATARKLLPRIEEFLALHAEIKSCAASKTASAKRKIRLSMPTNIARPPTLAQISFYATNIDHEIDIELFSDLDHQDILNDQADIAVLPYCPTDPAGLLCEPFMSGTNFLLASPSYLEKRGSPQEPEDLEGHLLFLRNGRNYPMTRSLLTDGYGFDLETFVRYEIPVGSSGAQLKLLSSRVASKNHLASHKLKAFYGDSMTCLQAVLGGMGIAVDLSLGLCDEYLKDGRLVPVLLQWHRPLWINTLVMRERSRDDRQLCQFARWFADMQRKDRNKCWKNWYRHFGVDPAGILKRGY